MATAIVTICSAWTIGAQAAPAVVPPYRARLLGVYNGQTGEPVEGAEVIDALSKTSALTTKTGTVSLAFLPDGGSMIRVQKIGFQPTSMVVAISPVDTIPLTVVLEPVATALPAVVTRDSAPRYVSPGLRGFEERRKLGFGHFVTDSALRKSNFTKMTSVVRTLPNLHITCPLKGLRTGECWAVSGRQTSKFAILGGQCALDVYIDGAVSTDNDLEKLPVDQFSGVELYSGAATIPPQYNRTGASCGVLLFWTRER